MKTVKRSIASAFIGIGVGTLINYLFVVIAGRYFVPATPQFLSQFKSELSAVGVQLIIFALLGVIQGNASRLFAQVETKQSLLKVTCLHYLLVTVPLLLAGWYLGWFQAKISSLLTMLIFISLVYVLIYLFNYLAIKKDIQQINAKL